MFNPARASLEIKREFIDYIRTRNHFSDSAMEKSFVQELHRTVSKGPILDIKDTFEPSKSIMELIREGVLTEEFLELEAQKPNNARYKRKLPLTRPLYTHQEKAVRHITAGHNAVVTTGTGSGKTECFLIPLLNELLDQKRKGTLPRSGVQAILIYPMNALANDQLKRLRELLMFYPDITFGVYTGDTKDKYSEAENKYISLHTLESCKELQMPLSNELISREQMIETPPHILCTNYAMLEHLLLRPDTKNLFADADMRFIILDEAHVYHGVTGMETSLLLRRLKARIRSTKNVRFVLTSATLGTKGESDEQIVHFAKTLTGEEYHTSDIIFGKRNVQQFWEAKLIPVSFFHEAAQLTDLEGLEKVYAQNGFEYDMQKEPAENLFDLCMSAQLYQDIRRKVRGPVELKDFASMFGLTEDESIEIIHVLSQASKNGVSLIDVRYHYFIRALEGIYNAPGASKNVYLTRKKQVESNGQKFAAFEISVCPNCGETALVGKIGDPDENNIRKLEMSSQRSDARYFMIDDGQSSEDVILETEPDNEENEEVKKITPSKTEAKFERYYLCAECGAITEEVFGKPRCGCSLNRTFLLKELTGKGATCPNCVSDKMSRLYLPNNVATAVLGTSLFETLESREVEDLVDGRKYSWVGGKQFLAFSDNRAEAAHFAPYLSKYYAMFLRKRGIAHVLEKNKDLILQNTYTVSDLASDVKSLFLKNSSFAEKLDDRENVSLREREKIAEKSAWIGILGAMLDAEKADGMTALGFLQFRYRPLYDPKYNVIPQYARFYHTSEATMEALLNSLLMTIVRFGALRCPVELSADELKYVFFSQREKCFTRDTVESLPNHIMGWMPRNRKGKANQWYRNTRQDLVMRTLSMNEQEANDFLGKFFDEYLRMHILDRRRTKNDAFFLNADDFDIMMPGDPRAKWYKCTNCGHITVHNIDGKCSVRNCVGALDEISAHTLQDDNHYVRLYRKEQFQPLLIREHTAQLSRDEGQSCQQDFEKNRINALSCSTTFEMGVDVGDLETVFMRDVPPTAANYAQRAGRAGRSKHAAAYALTYAKLSSHDFTFFETPNRLIEGKIQPPTFKLDNEKVLLRHIYAVVLSYLFHQNAELFGKNKFQNLIDGRGEEALHALLKDRPERLTELLGRSFGAELDARFGITTYRWADKFIGEQGTFTRLVSEYQKTIDEYNQRLDELYLKARNDPASNRMFYALSKRLNLYQNEQLISMLSRNNVLPKYGFPVDTAELTPSAEANGNDSKVHELQMVRDLKLAISEYAPGAKVIADNKMFTSRYVRKSSISRGELDFHKDYVTTCPNCGEINYARTDATDAECIMCKAKLTKEWLASIEPRAGFITEPDYEAVPMRRPKHPYVNDACYIGDGKALNTYSYRTADRLIRLHSSEKDKILILSKQHFYICNRCGYSIGIQEIGNFIKGKKERQKAEMGIPSIEGIKHTSFMGIPCNGQTMSKTYLHHIFETDVVRMELDRSVVSETAELSVLHALLNATSQVLEVELSDIGACRVHNSGNFSIIFYDTCAGGAGHVHRMLENNGKTLEKILHRAYRLVQQCTCDTSCYSCLRDYSNQRDHEKLDRHQASEVLSVYQDECCGWMEGESAVVDCQAFGTEKADQSDEKETSFLRRISITDDGMPSDTSYRAIWEQMLEEAYESWEEDFFHELINRAVELENCELPMGAVHLQVDGLSETLLPRLCWPNKKTALFFIDWQEKIEQIKNHDWNLLVLDERISPDELLNYIKEG